MSLWLWISINEFNVLSKGRDVISVGILLEAKRINID